MFRSRSWFGGGFWKPKNPHSVEHLKYLYNVLSKNQTVSEGNRGLLVETLRSIAEILIWGDQNDSSVFDFFLEKNMLSFFLRIMKQKCGSYVCVQLLQTLNILFENIRNETSLYYLLSNNHVNSIIVHKFDFSDEEVMAYYISFLKTLSLKLNSHTIHFFYNEHTNDFPLYTEAIKFFNHSEKMVRIAVRTLTLNVYRVEDKSMLKFIRNKTAAPYFSNLVWFIGNHVLELDACIRNDADDQSRTKLADLVAEHLDQLHYLNDILCLDIPDLNDVLSDHLLNRLLIPLYVYSLTKRRRHSKVEDDKPHVSSVVSLFLLSQVFLIITHIPLVRALAWIILNGDMAIFSEDKIDRVALCKQGLSSRPGFRAPSDSLEKMLEGSSTDSERRPSLAPEDDVPSGDDFGVGSVENYAASHVTSVAEESITDEEKEQRLASEHNIVAAGPSVVADHAQEQFSLSKRPFLEAIFNALECSENDYAALFALCLLYALGHNPGINQEILDAVLMPTDRCETKQWYNRHLMEKLIVIIGGSCYYKPGFLSAGSKVRVATLEMATLVVKQLVIKNGRSYLLDNHFAAIEGACEESILLLRNFYKSEEIFLDMFEDEYSKMKKSPLNVEYLMMDSNVLLPPTGTPMTGIELNKRLPCGEAERARRAIRVFFIIRDLSLTLRMEPETHLPLTSPQACIQVNDVLDLNNSDLLACTVISKDGSKIKRFLVIDIIQLILVEPDNKRVGWGVAKFVGFLQDVEVTGDKDDSRCLHITIHRMPSNSATPANRVPLLSAKFVFDDHIRCMAAKQRLTKGRLKARQRKMHFIAKLLEIPGNVQPCPSPPSHAIQTLRQDSGQRRNARRGSGSGNSTQSSPHHRPLFNVNKVPGFAAAVVHREREGSADSTGSSTDAPAERRPGVRSRDGSPRMPRPRSEEIPLEDMSLATAEAQNFGASSSLAKARKTYDKHRRRQRSASSSTDRGSNSGALPVAVESVEDAAAPAAEDAEHDAPEADPVSETSFNSTEQNSWGSGKRRVKGAVETV